MTRRHVIWSEDERDILRKEMTRLIVAAYPRHYSSRELVRESQQVLPSDRRRPIYGNTIATLLPLIESARGQAIACRLNQPPKIQPVPTLEPVQEEPAQPPATPHEMLLGALFENLVDLLADRIIMRVLDALPREAAPEAKFQRHHTPWQQEQGKPDLRPGVLVIGLLDSQVRFAADRHPGLDLTFLTAEGAAQRHQVRRAHTVLTPCS